MTEIQRLLADLQRALKVHVHTGSLTLHLHQGAVKKVEYTTVVKVVDTAA